MYDIGQNAGWVNVGIDHDTAAFAVESIRRWWQTVGTSVYPNATRLLITADCGGSNGYRVRLWKLELQRLGDETGLALSVSHFPPGTSKWNKIEHRLFSFITQNWRGKPLISYQVIIDLIAATTTTKGLTMRSVLDENTYEKGRTVSDEERPPSTSSPMPSTGNGTTPSFRGRRPDYVIKAGALRSSKRSDESNYKQYPDKEQGGAEERPTYDGPRT